MSESGSSPKYALALLACASLIACSDGEPTPSAAPPAAPAPTASTTPTPAVDSTQAEPREAAPWVPLLGADLGSWKTLGDANWRLEDGVVQADGGRGFLVSELAYTDFELRIEFWASADANSGVFVRCTDRAEVTPANAYEVNIFDQRPDQTYRTGGIVDVAPPAAVISTADQWNRYEIRAQGNRLRVVLNGAVLVDTQDERFASGPIALQYGAGLIRFRNAQIRAL